MAEMTPQERLLPFLLDRLVDEEPQSKVESRERRVISFKQFHKAILRDLQWLLNSATKAERDEIDEFPEVAKSVLNYGMPDLAGRTASSVDARVLERLLVKVIADFEPRLLRSSIKVKIIADPEKMNHNAMCFGIEAELWAQPLPLRLFLRTDIDLETGSVNVTDQGQG